MKITTDMFMRSENYHNMKFHIDNARKEIENAAKFADCRTLKLVRYLDAAIACLEHFKFYEENEMEN